MHGFDLLAQERILKTIHELYEKGPGGGGSGSIGLLDIANDPLLKAGSEWAGRVRIYVEIPSSRVSFHVFVLKTTCASSSLLNETNFGEELATVSLHPWSVITPPRGEHYSLI